MWRELHYFVRYCGVTPRFALYSATLLNAQLAGVGAVTGSIEAGKARNCENSSPGRPPGERTLTQQKEEHTMRAKQKTPFVEVALKPLKSITYLSSRMAAQVTRKGAKTQLTKERHWTKPR